MYALRLGRRTCLEMRTAAVAGRRLPLFHRSWRGAGTRRAQGGSSATARLQAQHRHSTVAAVARTPAPHGERQRCDKGWVCGCVNMPDLNSRALIASAPARDSTAVCLCPSWGPPKPRFLADAMGGRLGAWRAGRRSCSSKWVQGDAGMRRAAAKRKCSI